MKRDWDVIREVLLEVEQIPHEARTTFGYQISAGQTAVERSQAELSFCCKRRDTSAPFIAAI